MSQDIPNWQHQFASDNTSPICPEAWDALRQANEEEAFAPGYGADRTTAKAAQLIRDLFEFDCDVFFVFNGSAANSLALATICQPYHGILCHPLSHADTDEANAPEFFTRGAKILKVEGPDGKIDAANIPPVLERGHGIHSAKVRAVTITQATEVGAVYTPDEIARLTAIKRARAEFDFKFHMDGARFANAVAALGVRPKEITWQVGIDVLTFGGKNGGPPTEALVFFDKSLAQDFSWRQKQSGQLASKMRYLAAPWIGMLETGAWLRHAAHANACARKLGDGLKAIPGIEVSFPVEANAVFARLPDRLARALADRGWHFYYFSDVASWRFMCSWNTTMQAIDALLGDVKRALAC